MAPLTDTPEYVYKAQQRKLEAEASFYEEQAKTEHVKAAMEQRKWADITAGDPYHRVYRFDSEVSGKTEIGRASCRERV